MWKYLQVRALKRHNQYYSFIDVLYPHWILMPAFSESLTYNILGLSQQPRQPMSIWLTWRQQCLPQQDASFCKVTIRKPLKKCKDFYPMGTADIWGISLFCITTHQYFHRTHIFYITVHSPHRSMQRKFQLGRKDRILCALSIWSYRGNFWWCFTWRKCGSTWDHCTVKVQSAPGSFQMNEYIC